MSIRIPKDLKDKFHAICQEEYINPSALIRGWIEDFIMAKRSDLTIKSKAWSLSDLLGSTEEAIKESLAAQEVKVKMDAIDRQGNLSFICIVKMNESNYYQTSRLGLTGLFLKGPQYIVNNLKRVDDDQEIEKAKWVIKKLLKED